MTREDYDVVGAEIHRKALENVTNEMAISLVRTSGSPVVVDAKDFSTCVMDLVPEHLGFAAYVLMHFGTSLLGTRFISELAAGRHGIDPGDGWIVNDPYDGGAAHQGDVAVVMPMFHRDEQVGWGFVNMHILDVGGSGLGGIAPGARDVYSEGLRFPAIRAIRNGELDAEWARFIGANVRAPGPVVNDIRSMIAANKVGNQKLSGVIDRFGRERYEQFCKINKDITEDVLRRRIAAIPEGTYEAVEWCEFDGHGGPDRLLPVRVELRVANSELQFRFSGAPQLDGFVNAGKGAMWGQVASALLTTLGYGDIRVNGGFWRPIKIDLGPPGTIVNPIAPAPTSNGHVAVAMRAGKLVFEVLSQAMSRSGDPVLRGRIGAKPHDGPPVAGLIGGNQFGGTSVVFYLDHAAGIGGGAQTTGDGQDAYGCACMSGCGMTDLEVHESTDPLVFLGRNVVANSGGPGYFRGGQGTEQAFTVRYTDRLAGQLSNPCTEVPATGVGGGFPGAGSAVEILRGSTVKQALDAGRLPPRPEWGGQPTTFANNSDGLVLNRGDVLTISGGGGGGLGDPLLREPDRVAADVASGYVTINHALAAYGVVIDQDGLANLAATAAQRDAMRKARIGSTPKHPLRLPESAGVAVVTAAGNAGWACGSCGTPLAGPGEDWRKGSVVIETDIGERYRQLHMTVRRRNESPGVFMCEYYCPGCAMALFVDVQPGEELGTGSAELRAIA
jgi:N-methylhydantoinase B